MKNKEYGTMYSVEDYYWWYKGLRGLFFLSINSLKLKRKDLTLLDAGCGTGKLLESCKLYRAYGIEISEIAIEFCKKRRLNNVIRASICDIPFENNTFNIITSMDVLCHKGVKNDIETIKELYRVLDKEGLLFLNLPAYNFLQSRHDEAAYVRQRYTKKELREKIEKTGFVIEKITYRNTILFPLAAIIRLCLKKRGEIRSNLKPLPSLINKVLTYLLLIENRLIISGVNFPFGLSLYIICRKKTL